MKKLLFALSLFISFSVSAQRMLVLPDTPRFANQNKGVWVLRVADNQPYFSNGYRWVLNTGGISAQTVKDSLDAFTLRIVTSFNNKKGAVKGIDSIYFNGGGTIMYYRYNGTIFSQAISGTAITDTALTRTIIRDSLDALRIAIAQDIADSIAAHPGGGISDGDKGDINVTSSGTVWQIKDAATILTQAAKDSSDKLASTKYVDKAAKASADSNYAVLSSYHFIGAGTYADPVKPDSTHSKVLPANILASGYAGGGNKILSDDGAWKSLASVAGVDNFQNRNGKWLKGKIIYVYADSYGEGNGASTPEKGFAPLIATALGAELINFSKGGSTLEKRTPIHPISPVDGIDDTANIPIKGYNDGLLILAKHTNDVINNYPNYNSVNYFTDGSTIINNALSKGWDSSQILLMGVPWLGSAGFAQGAAVSGTPAATLARQDSFSNAIQQLSKTFHTLYFDVRAAQKKFDTAHIMAADQLHPNDSGHAFIAASTLQYLNLQYSSATGGLQSKEDVIFTSATNLTNTDSAWFATSGSGYGQTGLATTYLRAGKNGRLIFDYASGSSVLGFNSVNAQTGYTGMEAGILNVGGNLYKIDGGTLSGILAAVVSPYKYCLLREGSTFKVQYSTNFGNTWKDIDTLTYSSSADMYIVADVSNIGILIEPQFYQLIEDVPGAIVFSDGFANSQDGNNLVWKNNTKRLGIGTPAPGAKIHVVRSLGELTSVIADLSTYADDTAAGAAGLTAGMLYKTSAGVVMIKL